MRKRFIVFLFTTAVSSALFSQSLITVSLPRFIEGVSGTNTDRIPFAYRARLTGLLPNATYHFFNQVVTSSDKTSADGAGNCIFASATDDFTRTSNPALDKAGAFGIFTTDAAGIYEGWFITESTGNKRFVPGKYVFMRVILNDGASGTKEALRLTTQDSVRVVKLDPATTDSTGTGLRCVSSANPKDFVFTYDNTTGAGRPISGSFIESDGTDNSATTSYAEFYADRVDGVGGAFGVVLPNVLPNGIRRVERRSLATGDVVAGAVDADGVWPSGANTVNPSGGTTEIVLDGTDVQWNTDVANVESTPKGFALFQNYPNPFNPATVIDYRLPVTSHVVVKVYDLLGHEAAVLEDGVRAAGYHSIEFNASALPSGVYFYRITVGTLTQTKQMMLVK